MKKSFTTPTSVGFTGSSIASTYMRSQQHGHAPSATTMITGVGCAISGKIAEGHIASDSLVGITTKTA